MLLIFPNLVLSYVEKVFPFSQAAEAHQMMDDGENKAKLVLSMDELWDNTDGAIQYRGIPNSDNSREFGFAIVWQAQTTPPGQ